MTDAVQVKETKAQRAERLKHAKNPWEAFDEVRAFAREGRSSVIPEWASTYFKWWGIYTQGDGAGATGGKAGEGLATDYFMMRIAVAKSLTEHRQSEAFLAQQPGGLFSVHPKRVRHEAATQFAKILCDDVGSKPILLQGLRIVRRILKRKEWSFLVELPLFFFSYGIDNSNRISTF